MEELMERMENRLEERMLRMEQSILTQFIIIADKVDAVAAALSHCGISSGPTLSGMLAAAEDTRGSRAPCATPAMLQCLTCNLGLGYVQYCSNGF